MVVGSALLHRSGNAGRWCWQSEPVQHHYHFHCHTSKLVSMTTPNNDRSTTRIAIFPNQPRVYPCNKIGISHVSVSQKRRRKGPPCGKPSSESELEIRGGGNIAASSTHTCQQQLKTRRDLRFKIAASKLSLIQEDTNCQAHIKSFFGKTVCS